MGIVSKLWWLVLFAGLYMLASAGYYLWIEPTFGFVIYLVWGMVLVGAFILGKIGGWIFKKIF